MKIPVDNCPAGPDMDAAIAKALGWREEFVHIVTGESILVPPEGAKTGFNVDRAGNPVMPDWSTDIKAVWELVEEVVRDGSLSLRLVGPECPDETGYILVRGWVASFVRPQYVFTDTGQCEPSETVPFAVCRAFLKTKGVEYIEVPNEDTCQ